MDYISFIRYKVDPALYVFLRWLILFFITTTSLLLSSCAAILNKKTSAVLVKTTKPCEIIYNQDTVSTVNNQAWLTFKRGKKPLSFSIWSDSTRKTIVRQPVNSSTYYLNVFNYGIGFLVDLKNPKRFSYDPVNLDTPVERTPKREKSTPEKESLYLHVSVPEVNNFLLKPDGYGKQISTGCLGVIGGLDYYYADNRFVSITGGIATDFPFPFPAPLDRFDPYESVFTTFLSIAHNHKINYFSVGYGLSYTRNSWGIYPGMSGSDPDVEYVEEINNSAGAIITAYYRISRTFHIGIIYRPTFIRFETENRFAYEHLLTLDLAWKIRLKK